MPFQSTFASFGGLRGSEAITNSLGVVAVGAFLCTVMYIAILHLRESARRQAAAKMRQRLESAAPKQAKSLMEFDDNYNAELGRLQRGLQEFYDSTAEAASRKLDDLVRYAEAAFRKVSEAYALNSIGVDGETRANRASRFASLCERQWGYFRSEMSFIPYNDVHDNLRPILETARLLDAHVTRKTDEQAEMSADALRSQEIVAMARAVVRERVSKLQEDLREATAAFRDYYDRSAQDWVNDRVFRVVAKMRERGEKGLSIDDTNLKDKFNALKSRLEMVARLSERVEQNSQKVSDQSVAICQVVYVGTLLSIIKEMAEWFPEIFSADMSKQPAEKEEAEKDASASVAK